MDMDAILAAQMSIDDCWDCDSVDAVDVSAIADRIDAVQSSGARLEADTDYGSAVLRRFIANGVITPDGEMLIEWLEAGPSSLDNTPPITGDLLSKRIAELPAAIGPVKVLRDPGARMVLRNLLTLCRQHRTGRQALQSLEQTGGKLASLHSSDGALTVIPPAPFFSTTAFDTSGDVSDELSHLPDRTSIPLEDGPLHWKNRLPDFAKSFAPLPHIGGWCGISDIMEE